MASTKAQEAARRQRIDKAAEALYMAHSRHPHGATLLPRDWDSLKEEEKDRFRDMAEKAVQAYVK